MKATYKKYILNFKRPSGTSRGVLKTKETWFLILQEGDRIGVGECGILRTLSIDDRPDYEEKIQWVCKNIHLPLEDLLAQLVEFPSIQFGVEMALKSFEAKNPFQLFPSPFTEGKTGIKINGLIWMGEEAFMLEQIQQKLEQGFSCIKLKIGAIDFEKEIALLKSIRKKYSASEIELRVDANGAFSPKEALQKLQRLSELDLHSIEQPIKQGQFAEMNTLCAKTPLPIALDEELIGVFTVSDKEELLTTIQPQYIILKPSLVGGFEGSLNWINIAKQHNVSWWITSALESNIGLNAIAQFTYNLQIKLSQGLGTGGLLTNNIDSPLIVKNGALHYLKNINWRNIDAFFTD